ncbi:MAG: hypothetical protein RIG61_04075 [Deltaproteobacteria bacterium]
MARYVIPLIIIVALLVYFYFPGGDDTSEIEAVFNSIIESAGEKNLEGVTEHFSLHYKDGHGVTYPVLKNLTQNAFEKYDGFQASYSGLSATIGENENGEKEAAANLDIIVKGIKSGKKQNLIGSDVSPENITVMLKKSSFRGWKIIEVEGIEKSDYSQ